VLREYRDVLKKRDMSDADIDNFLQFLKIHISNLKFEPKEVEAPVYRPIHEYDVKYLSNASKTNKNLEKARKELNPQFSSLQS
jgi:hypothetical protein